jgi:hypothetical protein
MTSMIFYETPVALSRSRHRDLRLMPATGDFSFARNINSLLIAATELPDAALHYPVVFVGKPGGPYTLAAMVGLNDQNNLFLDADGAWEADAYIPAFARRYPFVLAEAGDGDDLTVCVDEAFTGWSETEGEALFDADGKESPMLQGAVEFLRQFHIEMQSTHQFAQRLAQHDLLVPKTVEITRDGKKQIIDGIYVVDAARLHALDDGALAGVVRNGDMGLIDAHLLSLKHVARLSARLDRGAAPPIPASL